MTAPAMPTRNWTATVTRRTPSTHARCPKATSPTSGDNTNSIDTAYAAGIPFADGIIDGSLDPDPFWRPLMSRAHVLLPASLLLACAPAALESGGLALTAAKTLPAEASAALDSQP